MVVDTLFLLINRVLHIKGLKMLKDQIQWGEGLSTRAASMNKCNWRPGKEFSWDQAKAERPQSILKA